MKFGKRLRDEQCPEWRLSYMDYKGSKKLIKRIQTKLEERYHIDLQMILNEVPPSEIGVPSDYLDKELASFADEMFYAATGSNVEEKSENNFINYLEEHGLGGMYLQIVPKETCQFFNKLEKELDKVNKFYLQTERKFCVRHAELMMQLSVGLTEPLSKNDKQKVRSAFQEHYRALLLLMNFRTLNFQGFSNILKKLDKYTKSKTKTKLMKRVRDSYFYSSKVLDYMMSQIEYKCSVYMFKGDRKKAKDFLRLPQTLEKQTSPFRSGISVGAGIVLSIAFVLTYVFLYPRSDPPSFSDATMYVYRLTLVPIILSVLVGVNLQIWQKARINYVFIFRFDPRDHLSVSQYIEMTMFMYNITMGSLLIYMYSIITNTFYEYAYLHPIFLFIFLFIYICFPYKWFYGHSRLWLFRIILRLLMAPFRKVEFADFWFADQLTSLSDFLFEIQFVYCVYPSLFVDKMDSFCSDSRSLGIPILNILPNYIRLMQCLRRYRDSKKPHPHITNAFKYLSSIIATLMAFLDKNIVAPTLPGSDWNYMRTTWIVANLISSCFKLIWDLKMDWSLLQFEKDSEHKLLRKELFFSPYFYYFSIVTNILARFFWIVVLLLKQFYSKYLGDQWIGFCFGLVEILRRFQWNCIRLENEHLNNVGEFRATNEIPLPFEISRMIKAKEKEITNVDKLLHYVFFFCNPRSDEDTIDKDIKKLKRLNPKNLLKTSLSHVSSMLGGGFAALSKDSHDTSSVELQPIKTNVIIPPQQPIQLQTPQKPTLKSTYSVDSIHSEGDEIRKSHNEFYKNPKPASTFVIDIEEENTSDQIDLARRKNSILISGNPINITLPVSQTHQIASPSTSNTINTSNVTSTSSSFVKEPSSKPKLSIITDSPRKRETPVLVKTKSFRAKETASQSAPKTRITIEDDEVPQTPHLTTILGQIFSNPGSGGEEDNLETDNQV